MAGNNIRICSYNRFLIQFQININKRHFFDKSCLYLKKSGVEYPMPDGKSGAKCEEKWRCVWTKRHRQKLKMKRGN